MLFHSWAFLGLLVITLTLFHVVLRGRLRAQHVMLLIASYIFYGWFDPRFLLLMWISTSADYFAGIRMAKVYENGLPQSEAKKALMLSLVVNLTILGFFKYFNFFIENVTPLLTAAGVDKSNLMLRIAIPVGISFYTFQSMAYSIDVYRRDIPAVKDPLMFCLYVAFFPQLVAGPIERAGHLIPGLMNPRRVTPDMVQSGIALMLIGFFKKLAIADTIAPFVDQTFHDTNSINAAHGGQILLSIYLFAIQVYADFSGYTDIARGTSRLFGIELMRNFEQPFLSTSVSELFRRWHMSMITWFRDYVFVPMGGSRVSRPRVYFNIMVLWFVSGLWHGASWNWIAWGLFNGILICIERLHGENQKARGIASAEPTGTWRIVRIVWTWHLFVLGCLILRNTTIPNVLYSLEGIFFRWEQYNLVEMKMLGAFLLVAAATLFIDLMQRRFGLHEFPMLLRPVWGGICLGIMLIAIIYWSDNPGVPFFYFAF